MQSQSGNIINFVTIQCVMTWPAGLMQDYMKDLGQFAKYVNVGGRGM